MTPSLADPQSAVATPRIMGILNVTPDSFSDGGLYLEADAAVKHALEMLALGADVVDVGGESTRPGAQAVSADQERRRVIPCVERLAVAAPLAVISVDTSKASVARAAVAAGARMVNDVTALRADRDMAAVVAEADVDCCLMHMQGAPRTMQRAPRYDDVVSEVKSFLQARIAFAVSEGVAEERILIDPGIGFGKTVEHNLKLIARLDELCALGRPVVIGTSRKSFLGRLTAGRTEGERLPATIATNVMALERGASVFRVHDVAQVRDALLVAAATVSARWSQSGVPTKTTRT